MEAASFYESRFLTRGIKDIAYSLTSLKNPKFKYKFFNEGTLKKQQPLLKT